MGHDELYEQNEFSIDAALVNAVMGVSQNALIIIDAHFDIRQVSRSFFPLFGYDSDEMIGQNIAGILTEYHDGQDFIRDVMMSAQTMRVDKGREYSFRHKNGHMLRMRLTRQLLPVLADDFLQDQGYMLICLSPLAGRRDGGREDELTRFAEDILFTQQQYEKQAAKMVSMAEELLIQKDRAEQHQRLIEYQASHDALTNLGNRFLMKDQLPKLFHHVDQQGGAIGLIYLDLDNLKPVNDTLGHESGDALITHISGILQEYIEGKNIAIRLGGDEFAVFIVIDDCDDHAGQKAHLRDIAAKILNEIRRPISLQGELVEPGASIGLALYPDHGHDMNQILHAADQSMYYAKKHGKNQICCYDGLLNQQTDGAKDIAETDLV